MPFLVARKETKRSPSETWRRTASWEAPPGSLEKGCHSTSDGLKRASWSPAARSMSCTCRRSLVAPRAGPGFTTWRLFSGNPGRVPPGRRTSGTPCLGSPEDKGDLGTRGRERAARGPGCRGTWSSSQEGSREETRVPRLEHPQNVWDGRGGSGAGRAEDLLSDG